MCSKRETQNCPEIMRSIEEVTLAQSRERSIETVQSSLLAMIHTDGPAIGKVSVQFLTCPLLPL